MDASCSLPPFFWSSNCNESPSSGTSQRKSFNGDLEKSLKISWQIEVNECIWLVYSRVRSPLEQKAKFKGSCCLQYLLVENTWKFWSWMFFNESLFKEQKICDLVQVSCTLAANALCRLWRLSSWTWTCSRRRDSIIAFTSWTDISFCLLTVNITCN